MEICFAGTGAANWNWTKPLTSENRGSTCTLLDNHILIDAGPTLLNSLELAGKDYADVTDLFITHTHSDHFNFEQIEKLSESVSHKQPLRVYVSSQGADKIRQLNIDIHVLKFGENIPLKDGVSVCVLPANHLLTDPDEPAYHFLFTLPDGKRLLYALDGAWMISRARVLLGQEHVDMIVWDATSGTSDYDWRFAEHNDLLMIRHMQKAMENLGMIDKNTKQYFDHIAKFLWPESAAERKEAADKFNGTLAEDGMIVRL